MDNFTEAYGRTRILDVGARGTKGLDSFALGTWFDGTYRYDMLHLDRYQEAERSVNATVSVNFTSLHAMPTTVNAFTSSMAKAWVGREIEAVNHPCRFWRASSSSRPTSSCTSSSSSAA